VFHQTTPTAYKHVFRQSHILPEVSNSLS